MSASSLDLLVGRVIFIGLPFDPFVPVVVVELEVQQAGILRHITVVCSMLEGLLKTEGEGWLQAVESRTAPGVGWRKPHVSCQAPRVT